MAADLQLNQTTTFTGAGTYSFTAPAAGTYKVQVNATLPPGSELSLDVKLNGTTVDGSIGGGTAALGPALGYTVAVVAASGDTIAVVAASSAAVDSVLNAVKGTISLYQTEQL